MSRGGHSNAEPREIDPRRSSAFDRPDLRSRVLALAAASIRHGLATGSPCEVVVAREPAALQEPGACFVTLRQGGELRGCVGEIEACRPLAESISRAAFGAAFRDSRFPPLQASELDGLEVHVSVLGPLEPLSAADERELFRELRPGIDGLVLRCGAAAATFLPAVWESLPEPGRFLAELKQKAGLPQDVSLHELELSRYHVIEIEGEVPAAS